MLIIRGGITELSFCLVVLALEVKHGRSSNK